MTVFELNIDGLVGPTHHYAGLAPGNQASMHNAEKIANPRAAALQGLAKMRLLHSLGLKQAVLPPQPRPHLALLHQLGFYGTAAEQISQAYKKAPQLLSACYSASSMWAANAATVSAASDTQNNKVHFTAANLVSNLHRHCESDFSAKLLKAIFKDTNYFTHHEPLPKTTAMGDEGAANYNRLCLAHAKAGLHLFVYGKSALIKNKAEPIRYPARQTLEASQAIARSHGLDPNKTMFAQQNPEAIDQGVFHNDVIAVANEGVFLLHEQAFVEQAKLLKDLQDKADFPIQIIEVKAAELSLEDAVSSYLFNSQLITLPSQRMALIAPIECQMQPRIKHYIDKLIADTQNPITEVHYLDLRQSMQNGGGPACLRLRLPLSEAALAAMHQGVLVSHQLLDRLEAWVNKHYRNSLQTADLACVAFIEEVSVALDELAGILGLEGIYCPL